MKKYILVLLTLFLLSPLVVFAIDPNVKTLEAGSDGATITYNGTTEGGSVAVMCKLYDSESEEIDLFSTAVDNNEFSGEFIVKESGEYTVSCANYEGGNIISDNVSVDITKKYTVTFNTNGGTAVADQKVIDGSNAVKPEDPTRDGFVFVGWYEDDTLTTEFNFTTSITDNTTIYAKWEEVPPVIEYTISFNTNGGSEIQDLIINDGDQLILPEDPTKNGFIFVGWYEDDTLTTEFNSNKTIDDDLTLYAKWEEVIEEKDYTATDENGNSIEFKEETGKTFKLTMIDVEPLNDTELEETVGINRDQYNQIKDVVEESIKEYGDLVAFYDIIVEDTNSGDEIHTGPFKIKIKMTDEMKKYDIFKLAYVKNDFSIEEPIELTIEGDYLVGTLPHLSAYVLIGNKATPTSSNPYTYDNIMMWIGILFISIIGMAVVTIVVLKKEKHNINKGDV